jgi:hypothetical protein
MTHRTWTVQVRGGAARRLQTSPKEDDMTITPVPFARDAIHAYARACGNPVPDVDFSRVVAKPARARAIALAYMAAPSIDRAALPYWEHLRSEIRTQYDLLTRDRDRGGVGVTVTLCRSEPYPGVTDMLADLRENRRLKVYATGGPGNEHPLLTPVENDMFRAIHDAFGHAAAGRGFDADGEEAAWLHHALTFSPPARKALATELRGQNSALNSYYRGTQFAEQKVVVLPEGLYDLTQVTFADPVEQPG